MNNSLAESNPLSLNNSKLYLVFKLGEKSYAINTEFVEKVEMLSEPAVFEKMPDYVMGVINFNNQNVSIIDLNTILGLPNNLYNLESKIIFIKAENSFIGIISSNVENIVSLSNEDLKKPDYSYKKNIIDSIVNINGNLIGVINPTNLIRYIKNNNLREKPVDKTSPQSIIEIDDNSKKVLRERALKLTKKNELNLENTNQTEGFVSFELNNELYGIDLKKIKGIFKLKNLRMAKVPCVPEFILGIANIRGEFITIVDINKFLRLKENIITDKTKIIVIYDTAIKIGFPVDDIGDMISIPIEKTVPNYALPENNKFIKKEVALENGDIINIFDSDQFLKNEKLFIEDAV